MHTFFNLIGDENIKLEHENERVVQEMIRFREEYKLKFRELKKLVGDQPLSTIQESVVEESHASSSSAPPPKGKQLNPQEKIETASEKEERLLRRQNQLEQTVGGLLDKYYAVSSSFLLKLIKIYSYYASL